MEIIQWNETLSVSNSLIDSQHKRLVSLINELHTAMKEGRGKEVLQKILDDLITYTKEHFATEEKMMQKANFPFYNQHKLEHDNLTKKAVELQSSYRSGNAPLTLDVMTFLKNWLVNHIMGSDKKYQHKI